MGKQKRIKELEEQIKELKSEVWVQSEAKEMLFNATIKCGEISNKKIAELKEQHAKEIFLLQERNLDLKLRIQDVKEWLIEIATYGPKEFTISLAHRCIARLNDLQDDMIHVDYSKTKLFEKGKKQRNLSRDIFLGVWPPPKKT
jgi:hypothetical protein